jgi:predicted amino acid-binding ACT domain protein
MSTLQATRPGLIISVFQQAGLCAGNFPYQSVAEQMKVYLKRFGVRVLEWEPVAEHSCCAVLMFAEAERDGPTSVLQIRRELAQELSTQGLQLRIQREDVFLAMHRLSS